MDAPTDLEVTLSARPRIRRVHVRGLPPPLTHHTLRAAAWYGLPPDERRQYAWVEGAGSARLVGPRGHIARQAGPSLHLSRAVYAVPASVDAALSLAMVAQPERIFLHMATLGGAAGALGLTGVSGAGKTTLTLDLTAAGLSLGGDELCGIEPERCDAWPLPRAPIVRDGSRLPFASAPPTEQRRVTTVPGAWPSPRPLRALLLLTDYAERPSIQEIQPDDPRLYPSLLDSVVVAASWGTVSARHALRVGRLDLALRRIRLGALSIGPRAETTALVHAWWRETTQADTPGAALR